MIRAHVEAKRGNTALAATLSVARPRKYLNPAAAGRGGRRRSARAPANPRWRARWRRSSAPHPVRSCCAATRSASASTARRQSSASAAERLHRGRPDEAVFADPASPCRKMRGAAATRSSPMRPSSTRRTATAWHAAALNAGRPLRRLVAGGAASGAGGAHCSAGGDASDATVEVLRRAYRTECTAGGTGRRSTRRCRHGPRASAGRCARPACGMIRIGRSVSDASTSGGDSGPWPFASSFCR